jgi:FlgD Ig-like domain
MSPEARRAQLATALLVVGLLGGSAAAFAYTEHLKLEKSPVYRTRVGKLLAPNCTCLRRRIPIQFTLRKPDRLTVVVVDSEGNVARTLLAAGARHAGRQRFAWNGRDDLGRIVRAGTYKPRLHLANEHRTILMPNPITVDPVPPTIKLVSLGARVFTPRPGAAVAVRFRTSEPARGLLYVNGIRYALLKRYAERGLIRWRGRQFGRPLPSGRYRLALAAVDLAGNLSARVPIGVARILYVEVRPHVQQARPRTRIGFRVDTGARHFAWRFRSRRGTSAPGLLVLRTPAAPGRYRLVVTVSGHSAQALVIVRAGG